MSHYTGPFHALTAMFAQHRVAANLLMILMILAGLWGVKKLNTQFFPSFEIDIITIGVSWSGAAAEDVESSIVLPIEEEIRAVNGIKKIYATSKQGRAAFRLELQEGVDPQPVLDDVKQKVDAIRTSLPSDANEPVVQRIIRYEQIASLLLTSDRGSLEELRPLAYRIERELLETGIRKVDIKGLPAQEIAVQVPTTALHTLGMSLQDIAREVKQRSLDLPAGTVAKKEGAKQVRTLNQQRDVEGFEQLPLLTDNQGRLVRLGDIADIQWRAKDEQITFSYHGQPAVLIELRRTEDEDALQAAERMHTWLQHAANELPQGVELIAFDEFWQAVQDRIDLLLKNGLGGLVLVVIILFLFLNARVAFWVTVGIPVSFLTTLAILYMIGGSINMLSLFGLIMALGIIVDDAIVVGEDTLTHLQQGENGLTAAIGGAQRMLAPVVASSMTTIAAFLPLLLIGGIIGQILIDIPTVVICVIIASLIECFLVLPGHLYHSLRAHRQLQPSGFRIALERRIDHFKEHLFRRIVRAAIRFRWATLTSALGIFIIAIGLIAGGRVKFVFFPNIDGEDFSANVQFNSGTDPQKVQDFLNHLDTTLADTEADLGGNLLTIAVQHLGQINTDQRGSGSTSGEEFGSLYVEMTPVDARDITNREFVKAWRQRIHVPPDVEKFTIDQATTGPSGKPVEIKLIGTDINTLKQASLAIQAVLKGYQGLSNVDDDLPFGKSQLIYALTPAGEASGLRLQQIASQLSSAFNGIKVQTFYKEQDEVEVRIMLPDHERNQLRALDSMPIVLPDGSTTPLANLVSFKSKQGLNALQRVDGQLSINITADLNETVANANEIITDLKAGPLPKILSEWGVEASFEGKNRNQRETLTDMKMGLILALALIYIILAWVFSSYSWPVTVMLAIPLGLTGAIFGHLISGLDLTILSLFGFFGLSGIVINDSIVLVTFYQKLRASGMAVEAAIEEATCQRLRAVLLTSLTTIAGLTPILFETSLQAQFLIPMATSIVFGLAYGTLLILLFIPATLTVLENTKRRFGLKLQYH